MAWPTFLFLGAPRSGTTQLYEGLRLHPEVAVSGVKEPLYFVSPRYPLHRVTSAAAYQALFRPGRGVRATGEFSTLYLYDPEAAQRIHDTLPTAKLLAILRHPVERAYSQYVFERLLEQEPCATFEDALRAEPRRIAEHRSPFLYYREVGRYASQIRRYQALFPADQLLWLLYDDLKTDLAGTFRRIFRFIGVDDAFEPDIAGRVNVSGIGASIIWSTRARDRSSSGSRKPG
jgi:hypothetical protein